MRVQLLRVAALIGLLFLAGFLLPKLGPEAPGAYEGVVAAPTSPRLTGAPTPTTTVPGPPPGFPSMEYAPPEIEVPDGDPIPIDTKYGISYTVPGDWRFLRGGVVGWESAEGSVRFGDIADYGYDYCPESRDGATKADAGITGRNGVDEQTAAFEVSRAAELIFRDEPGDSVAIDYSDPIEFEIDGAPAVRYTVKASNLPRKHDCDPTEGTLDIVATQGYSNATVAVFMIVSGGRIDGALPRETIDQIVSTLRRT
ncbi:hypothetical protein [Rhodococcoides yunnanense]|uniref:hypothetical protein n=1 Tax=Rhodococcoides yunnanense TaxID=278209 RepID=UPI001FE49762|nr:hypothetical protein [Rhodococcus yunnanensis]